MFTGLQEFKTWKKLVMLSDSFEVSTSHYDQFSPGDYYHSTRRATVQPNHQRKFGLFPVDANMRNRRRTQILVLWSTTTAASKSTTAIQY